MDSTVRVRTPRMHPLGPLSRPGPLRQCPSLLYKRAFPNGSRRAQGPIQGGRWLPVPRRFFSVGLGQASSINNQALRFRTLQCDQITFDGGRHQVAVV